MHLEISFCGHYCGQMTILALTSIGQDSLEKEHPFLMNFVFYECFHPVECTAREIPQCNSIDVLGLPGASCVLSIVDRFPCL